MDCPHPQAGDAVALFLGLYLGHILGDFVFQPGRLVVAKRRRLSAAVLHTTIVTGCTALVLLRALDHAWLPIVLTGVAHLGVEELTIHARRTSASSNVTVFLLDQALHIVAMAVVAVVMSGAVPSPVIGPWPVPLQMLAATCGLVTVAFGGSILVFEVQVALDRQAESPDPILALDGARVYGVAERAAALSAALLLPLPTLGVLAFAPRAVYAAFAPADRKRGQFAAALTGLALCAIAWLLVSSLGPAE